MSKPSFKYNELIDAFRKLDLKKVASVVANDDLSIPDIARVFVEIFRESGCLLLKYPAPQKEKARDEMAQMCGALISECPEAAIRDDLSQHIVDAQIFEKGFREILTSLNNSDICKQPPAEQAWGIIHRSFAEFAHLTKTTRSELTKLATKKDASFDPNQFRLPTTDKKGTSPDAVLNEIIQGLGLTLSMLGNLNKWFDEHGTLVLPDLISNDVKIEYQSGTFTLLAMQWRHLEHAWERSRFFKAKATLVGKNYPDATGTPRALTILQVEAPGEAEAKDRVALDRLIQVFAQRQMSLGLSRGESGLIGGKGSEPVPLVPAGHLTLEEYVSADVLTNLFHVPVEDSAQQFAGLTLKEWLRGYAYLGKLARSTSGEPIPDYPSFTEQQLIEGLMNSSLPEAAARQFLLLTSISKTSADLFDTPLIKSKSGALHFFAPAFHSPVLGLILLSRLASLNRRRDDQGQMANDCQFVDKGAKFERAVLHEFTRVGIPAHGFRFSLHQTEYDCDAAVLLGETLFIFECKNYTLPMSHIPSLYYFMQSLPRVRAQAMRIASDLEANPNIVRKYFGSTAVWKQVVPVVLFALPWATGKKDGCYVYDASALSRLVRDGSVAINAVANVGDKQVRKRHVHALRKGSVPTAEELEKDMACPSQLKLHIDSLAPLNRPCHISDKMAFSIPEWSHRSLTIEEQLICLGETPESAAKIAHDFEHNFPTAIDNLRHDLRHGDKPTPITRGPKIGRNEKCPCGSGLKFKNCYLKDPKCNGLRPLQNSFEHAKDGLV